MRLFKLGLLHRRLKCTRLFIVNCQGYSLLRSGDLESAIGAQAMIQHTGISVVFFNLTI